MAQNLPIKYVEILNLKDLGIDPEFFGFHTTTMESHKYICVQEQTDQAANVIIVDLKNPHQLSKRPIKADSAIMNPKSFVIALKAAKTLQVFNLEMRSKMKSYVMNEEVSFWKWISDNALAIVTPTKVYHWTMDGDSDPQYVFDIQQELLDTQIINYQVSPDGKWCVLTGLTQIDQRIAGISQLYSIDKKGSQKLDSHAAAFCSYKVEGATTPSMVFAFTLKTDTISRLHVIEVGADLRANEPEFKKVSTEMYQNTDIPADFPVAMEISEKYSIIYLITKFGFFHIYDLQTATLIYANRISADTIFRTTMDENGKGIIGINKKGQVLSISINEDTFISYISTKLQNPELAIQKATECNLSGANDIFSNQLSVLYNQRNYQQAAKVVADSPKGFLRTPQTVALFEKAPPIQGQPHPLLQYFSVLLERGSLNSYESIELCRRVLQGGKLQLVEKWLKEEKLECSEELGDLIRQFDTQLALSVYLRAKASAKVVQSLAERGQYQNIIIYANKVGYQPDYAFLLSNIIRIDQAGAVSFVQLLLSEENEKPLIDIQVVITIFLNANMIKELTQLLLDVLKDDKEEDGPLQTTLLEINLKAAPRVADAILGQDVFSHYDTAKIAYLCEQAGLYQRALEHYDDLKSIKRVIVHSDLIPKDFLVNFFTKFPEEKFTEYLLDCLNEMLSYDIRKNLQVVVQIASTYYEKTGIEKLIGLFESYNSYEGLFYFLAKVVALSEDPSVAFKYIEAGVKIGQIKEVENIVKNSNAYDPQQVKEFLMNCGLKNYIPLIIVCDRFGFVDDLTKFLYKSTAMNYIEIYVQKISPSKSHFVVGALIDLDCNEEFIKNLVMSIYTVAPVEDLSEELAKRGRLKLLLPMLEKRIEEGDEDSATHSAIAKIYIDINRDPEKFLEENPFYDSLSVGKYCEKKNPFLAFVAYRRGKCDKELVEITNKNTLFKEQASYLVERQDLDLWEFVLSEENSFRQQLIDQVISSALPKAKTAEEVSIAVKAFIAAELPNQLINLLEKIVLENSRFSDNSNLQNLLLVTAIKADPSRVKDYIEKLNNYDPIRIADVAIGAELYEEAFLIFKKHGENVRAVEVLINNIKSLERGLSWAEICDEPDVWSTLAKVQLERGFVDKGIDSYLKADDPSNYDRVIFIVNQSGEYFEDLVKFLKMARTHIKEPKIETELIYAFARVDSLVELEELINGPNVAQIQAVADRCYDEEMYQAAKLLYNNVSNFSRLASTLIRLKEFGPAVDAARKANSTRTWKEVNMACVDAKEFRLAQVSGLNIIIHADEMDEVIKYYEHRGHFEEVIQLLEAGLKLESSHPAMFTELGILYSKYSQEKLLPHIKLYSNKMNIAKLIRQCDQLHQWNELSYLYILYQEVNNAVLTIINHPIESWTHERFKDVCKDLTSVDIFLSPKVDHSRVVLQFRNTSDLPLIKPYLISVQNNNIPAVNLALNELYIEDGEFENLRHSIDTFANFDQLSLAQQLEQHELIQFRIIAAYIYRKNKRYAKSVELSKSDLIYKDAIDTAAASKDSKIAEELLTFFAEKSLKECFSACLFTCYDIIHPDVALELSWRFNFTDFAMPFIIQVMREFSSTILSLQSDLNQIKEEKKKEEEDEQNQDEIQSEDDNEIVFDQGGFYDVGFNQNF
ncbi:clathrin heavy chain [Anaeramoeba ignava]|uniref:Clathrin heavy chain n=1 Tax=Anaeramoeba ignava TaxID=1746090 RepID=A0A9Q0LCC3_ANAIG|nr:clathrin heavy chain [Anaeramoeba ignava]